MIVTIRKTIIAATEARGWSAYKLGQEADVPIRTVQSFFNGTRDLTSERIDKLAAALGLVLRPVRTSKKAVK